MIALTKEPIDVTSVIDAVKDQGAGAIDVFIGTVRDQTNKKAVIKLNFESYEPMAIKELTKIADQAKSKWTINKLAIVHRVGVLHPGEIPVVVAVSTPHRKDAFEACRYVIDTLKQTVPIWKKEIFEDGEVWVAAHP